ncbi:hypothetical protein D516_0321 [Rhodobacter sp. AKP1]|nr:hypothetical protein D516_0321 [Rhodobacter sp. AKP1]
MSALQRGDVCFDGHSGSSLNRAFFLTWAFSGVLQGGSTVSFAAGTGRRRPCPDPRGPGGISARLAASAAGSAGARPRRQVLREPVPDHRERSGARLGQRPLPRPADTIGAAATAPPGRESHAIPSFEIGAARSRCRCAGCTHAPLRLPAGSRASKGTGLRRGPQSTRWRTRRLPHAPLRPRAIRSFGRGEPAARPPVEVANPRCASGKLTAGA